MSRSARRKPRSKQHDRQRLAWNGPRVQGGICRCRRERPDTNGKAKAGSLRLRLIVDGEHIRVLSAQEVDAPSTLPERVRGTHFLEVQVGNELLALDRLVDPGLAVGTPDPRDTSHSRGHRVVELASYELTVRVPLDALETVVSRSLQGLPAEAQSLSVPLEIAVYRATENLAIEPRRFDVLQATRSGQFVRTATTGQLNLDEVRRSVGGAQKPASYSRS